MKTMMKSTCLLGALLLGLNVATVLAQPTLIECGAESATVGSKLLFVNGANLNPASGFVQPLYYTRIASRYGTNHIYTSTNLLFTALSSTNPAGAAVGA